MGCVIISVSDIALRLNGKGNFSFGRLSDSPPPQYLFSKLQKRAGENLE